MDSCDRMADDYTTYPVCCFHEVGLSRETESYKISEKCEEKTTLCSTVLCAA